MARAQPCSFGKVFQAEWVCEPGVYQFNRPIAREHLPSAGRLGLSAGEMSNQSCNQRVANERTRGAPLCQVGLQGVE